MANCRPLNNLLFVKYLQSFFYLFLGIGVSFPHAPMANAANTAGEQLYPKLQLSIDRLDVNTLVRLDYLKGSTLAIHDEHFQHITEYPHYELLRQYLIELMIHWQQDPSSICHLPATYELLRQSSVVQSQLGRIEEICPEIVFINTNLEKIILNYKNLVGLDYVLGGRGQQKSASFGHTMLRLRYCSIEIPRVGNQAGNNDQDCLENPLLAQIFSFVAENPQGVFSVTGAISGEYPAHLILESDYSARNRYLYHELRDISYNQLALSREQSVLLFYGLAEKFWIPFGQYRFFSSNCAGEMLQLLKFAIRNSQLQSTNYTVITPKKLRRKLITLGYLREESTHLVVASGKLDDDLVMTLFQSGAIPVRRFSKYARTLGTVRGRWIEQVQKSENFIYQMAWIKLEQKILEQKHKERISAIHLAMARDKKGAICSFSDRNQLANTAADFKILTLRKAHITGIPAWNDLDSPQAIRKKISSYYQAVQRINTCAHAYPKVFRMDQEIDTIRTNIAKLAKQHPSFPAD